MVFSTIQLANEPIVIASVDLPLERYLESLRITNACLSQLAADTSGILYLVFDAGDQEVAFSDILIMLDELESDPRSWINYPHVQPVAVGTSPMLRVASKRFRQQVRIDMDVFVSLDVALDHIRAELHIRE